MKHLFGLDEASLRSRGTPAACVLNTDELINAHMLIAGMSGTGKSYQVMRLLESAHHQGVEIDAFDVHEELHEIAGSTACKFSESTRLGFNPLVPSLDPHSGGIRRQIEAVVDIINRTSRKLGPRQESALKNLLSEVYVLRGMHPDNPQSWDRRLITEQEFDQIVERRDYAYLRQCQPIVRDVISYTERKLKALSLGADNRCISALEKVEKTVSKIHSLESRRGKADSDEEIARLEQRLEEEKANAIQSYTEFVSSMDTGREYAQSLRFTNAETLKSVLERLHELQDGGIFRSNPPQWDGSTLRVHQIGSLRDDDRKLLFYMRCEAILRRAMDAGKTSSLRHLIFADEGHLYYSEDADNPVNRIAKEGRKFGLGLIIGSQSPTHFSEDFLTNVGTIILCGINSSYWDMAQRKLRCGPEVLSSARAREVAAIKFQRLGEPDPKFHAVNVNSQTLAQAVAALKAAREQAPASAQPGTTRWPSSAPQHSFAPHHQELVAPR